MLGLPILLLVSVTMMSCARLSHALLQTASVTGGLRTTVTVTTVPRRVVRVARAGLVTIRCPTSSIRQSRLRMLEPSTVKSVTKFNALEKLPNIFKAFFSTTKPDDKTKPAVDAPSDSPVVATQSKAGIKELWRKYGWVAVGTYLGIYVTTLSSLFLALDLDLFNAASVGFDPVESINKVCDLVEHYTGIKSLPGFVRQHPTFGTFMVAWVMTKFTEPIRLGITLAITPSVASNLRRLNLIKPLQEGESSKSTDTDANMNRPQ